MENNRKRAFGVCNYRYRQIELSFLLIPAMSDEGIKDTIIHEIAHALTPGHGHDKIWKSKCIELGGNGQRLGGLDKYKDGKAGHEVLQEKIAKYTLSCPCCDNKSYRNRKPSVLISCGMHGRGYNPKYKMIITQNY